MGAGVRVLLNTHVLLWWADGDARLSAAARAVLMDPGNELLVSSVSAFEIATKVAVGKPTLPAPPAAFLARVVDALAARELPVYIRHGVAVAAIPLHHRDPFDRLLVAQALVDDLVLLTQDAAIQAYPVTTVG